MWYASPEHLEMQNKGKLHSAAKLCGLVCAKISKAQYLLWIRPWDWADSHSPFFVNSPLCIFKWFPSLSSLFSYTEAVISCCHVAHVTRKPFYPQMTNVSVCPGVITGSLKGLAQANTQSKQWQSATSVVLPSCRSVTTQGKPVTVIRPCVSDSNSASSPVIRQIEFY